MKISVNITQKPKVSVIAPGYPVSAEDCAKGLDYLSSHEVVPDVPSDLLQPSYLHSNTDEKRFQFLKKALLAKDSEVIWCLRGGYGSNHLLPDLMKLKKPARAKLLIGISDITSLHLFFAQKWNWPTWHGPLLDRCGKGEYPDDLDHELWRLLRKEQRTVVFSNLVPMNKAAQKLKKIEGNVTGGNLTVLQSTLGTPFQLKTKNRFLFIEDLGERGYRIDRILEQFEQAKLFDGCLGVLVGEFLGGTEPGTQKNNFQMIFEMWASKLKIPLFMNLEAGHGARQRVLPLNTRAVLAQDKNKQFSLTVESGII